MRTLPLALAGLALFMGGCFLVPAPYANRLDPVGTAYAAVALGTPRDQLDAQFGAPARNEADGASVWETRVDAVNYNVLKVWFDAQGRAQKIETTRAHGTIGPGYQASAVVTRAK